MKRNIAKINRLLLRHFGVPERNLSSDPLDILFGTILSQNTNDRNSYKAYMQLKQHIKSWDDVLHFKPKQLESIIQVAGLKQQKAQAILKSAQYLKEQYGSVTLNEVVVKSDDEILSELTTVPGIGLKTASCVLLFGLQKNVCPVDTHVHRTMNRIGVVSTSAPDKTFLALRGSIPDGIAHQFHTNLIRLGREYCIPSKPRCGRCPVRSVCQFPEKNEDDTPVKEKSFLLLDSI